MKQFHPRSFVVSGIFVMFFLELGDYVFGHLCVHLQASDVRDWNMGQYPQAFDILLFCLIESTEELGLNNLLITIVICKLWLPRLKNPILIGSESFLVMAKWMATAEFSLTRPRMFISAIEAALTKAILDLKPQWAGTVSTASLISELAWLLLNFFMFFMIIPTSC